MVVKKHERRLKAININNTNNKNRNSRLGVLQILRFTSIITFFVCGLTTILLKWPVQWNPSSSSQQTLLFIQHQYHHSSLHDTPHDDERTDTTIAATESTPPTRTTISPPLPFPQIFLIHVGKTGGSTIRNTLLPACAMYHAKWKERRCMQTFYNRSQTFLSQATIGVQHCHIVKPYPSIKDKANIFLWTIRNPIHRVISWYHTSHPENIIPGMEDHYHRHHHHRHRHNKPVLDPQRNQLLLQFFHCFPTIDEWAQQLRRPYHHSQPPHSQQQPSLSFQSSLDCSHLAWFFIHGHQPHDVGHLYYNYTYYARQTIWRNNEQYRLLYTNTNTTANTNTNTNTNTNLLQMTPTGKQNQQYHVYHHQQQHHHHQHHQRRRQRNQRRNQQQRETSDNQTKKMMTKDHTTSRKTTIWAIRTEFLWEDYQTIEHMLAERAVTRPTQPSRMIGWTNPTTTTTAWYSSPTTHTNIIVPENNDKNKDKDMDNPNPGSSSRTTVWLDDIVNKTHVHETHNSERHPKRTILSRSGSQYMCCALRSEIQLYVWLLQQAQNLNHDARQTSIHQVIQQSCAVSSLQELHQFCQSLSIGERESAR